MTVQANYNNYTQAELITSFECLEINYTKGLITLKEYQRRVKLLDNAIKRTRQEVILN